MGLIDSIFGNSDAKQAGRDARFAPTQINTPGYGGVNVQPYGNKGRGGLDVSFSQDPTAQILQALGFSLQGQGAEALLRGDFSQGGQYGLGQQFDPFVNASFAGPGASTQFLGAGGAQGLQGLGLGYLGSDYSNIANQQTDLLRQQARPYEDLATTRALDRLQSRGGLGISTVLGDTFRGLNDQFAQNDLSYQLAGLDRADSLRNADNAIGLNLLQQGTNQGLGQQEQFLQGLGLLSGTGLQAQSQALQGRGQSLQEALAQFGSGGAIRDTNFQQLMQLLTGSATLSSARSGANAGAGGLIAAGNGTSNFVDLLGNLAGAYGVSQSGKK